jgi:hypothetical protein
VGRKLPRFSDADAGPRAWDPLVAAARAALLRRSASAVTPRRVAATVARALPPELGGRLWRALGACGWLSARARVPFDAVARARPPGLERWPAALVELAVFGVGGQGLSFRDRRREDLFQQFSAEITRGAVDVDSLNVLAGRIFRNAEVAGDAVLESMLRSLVSERLAALHTRLTPAELDQARAARSKLQRAFDPPVQSRAATQASFARGRQEFERYLAQFHESAALLALDHLRLLRQRFPAHVAVEELQRCEEQYDRLLKRAGQYRRQVAELAAQGMTAARTGDEQTAAWVVRRLYAIHAVLPSLLDKKRLAELVAQVNAGSEMHEEAEAAQHLRARELEVAGQIRSLAGVIHRFHEVAARVAPTDEAYRRAEANYRQAVARIRGLDTEWLTGLLLQLETLIADLDDPRGERQDQLDRFIASVRTALNRLRMEIRAHGQPPPPPAGSGNAALGECV